MLGPLVLAVALGACPTPAPAAEVDGPPVAVRIDGLCRPARELALAPASWRTAIDAPSAAAPQAPGDLLMVSKDDGVATTPAFGYEGRLSPSPGVAGPADYVAFRFATGDLAHLLPVTATRLTLGFDNLYGRTTWPRVGLARENAALPLGPDLSTLSAVNAFAAPLALPAPVGSGPDDIARFVADPPDLSLDGAFEVDDGGLSDAFDRPDGPLQELGSPWLDCTGTACPGAGRFGLAGGQVRKLAAGSAFAPRFARDPAVQALRPIDDRDLAVRVTYDVSAATAAAAGMLLRAETVSEALLDRYYVVQYEKGPPTSVAIYAVSGGTASRLGSASVAAADRGTLEARVEGLNPVRLRAYLNGAASPTVEVLDPTYRLAGPFVGLGSWDGSGAALGETWDGFEVRRNADLYVVAQLPAGEDAALPAERSAGEYVWSNVLFSRDGSNWSPAVDPASCLRPPQGFAQVEVRDDSATEDNVFRYEYKLDGIDVSCPACLTRLNPCRANPSPNEASGPVLEVGVPADIQVSWWDEHRAALDQLLVRLLVYEGDCFLGTPLVADLLKTEAAQGASPARDTRTALAGWTPQRTGRHCIVAFEFYDLNRDGCPDGFESGPPCTPVGNPDQNPLTQGIARAVEVFAPCTPATTSNLAGNSLRLARSGTAGETVVAFGLADPLGFPQSFNLVWSESKAETDPVTARGLPPWSELTGVLAASLELPAVTATGYLVVFQNDGCESQRSLADP